MPRKALLSLILQQAFGMARLPLSLYTLIKEGFVFYEAGGTESIYNDNPEIKELKIGSNTIPITSNVLIKQSTYTLGTTGEYKKILNNPTIWLDLIK